MTKNRLETIEKEWTEKIQEITLARLNKDEIEAIKNLTGEEKNQKLREKALEVWKEFAVHGMYRFDQRSGKFKLLPFTDLDGKISLGLLKTAGFDISKVTYVPPGEFVPSGINLDTGGQSGVVVKEDGTAFFDHHGERSTRASISTSKLVYRTLATAGLLKRDETLDALTKFVTQIDNQTHPDLKKREVFERSDRTILGLQRFLTFETALGYFKSGRLPTEELSDEDLERYNLTQGSKEQEGVINRSREKIKELERNGFVIETRFGKMLIDINGQLPGGHCAVRPRGYDAYCIFSPATKSFFIGVDKGNLDVKFSQGKLVRGCLWIKSRDGEKLKVSLNDIISQMADEKFKPAGRLKKFLDREKPQKMYEVVPQKTRDPKTGQYNWTTGELGKLAIFPFDFEPKPGAKYRVVISQDTAPGQRRGIIWLKVLGEAEGKNN